MKTITNFANNEIYHIYNRGVEKRTIFLNEKDYLRFMVNLYEFNNIAPAFNSGYFLNRDSIEVRLQYPRKKKLVEILVFCLMPNHYHLLLRQCIENGITYFMRKLGTGYTNFFNLKYERVGALFQGKFKAILLEQEAHFIHLPHYIHLNPLELIMSEWKEQGGVNAKKAMGFLEQYRWSSFPDYLEKDNFPTVTDRSFLKECIGGPKEFLKNIKELLEDVPSAYADIEHLSLE